MRQQRGLGHRGQNELVSSQVWENGRIGLTRMGPRATNPPQTDIWESPYTPELGRALNHCDSLLHPGETSLLRKNAAFSRPGPRRPYECWETRIRYQQREGRRQGDLR